MRPRRLRLLHARRAVAISFDDGPADATCDALALLRTFEAKATFFMIGSRIPACRDIVAQIAREGHELGNHTFNHPRLEALSPAQLEEELRSTSDAIEEAAGVRPRLFRPPYGLEGLGAAPVAARLGMTTVRWNVNPKDWLGGDAETIAGHVIDNVVPGAVVLLHDGSANGAGDRSATVGALGQVLPRLRANGYSLVTISDLLEGSGRARRTVVVRRRSYPRRLAGRLRRGATRPGELERHRGEVGGVDGSASTD
jgi:peptidoglycan/xylan/chitin deacetylase (PgdA/CDA1 family)